MQHCQTGSEDAPQTLAHIHICNQGGGGWGV